STRLPRRGRLRRVRRSARCAALFLSGLLGVGGWMNTASAQEELLQELKTVARVQIEGRHQLSAGAIRKVLKTRGLSRWPWRHRRTLRFDSLRADVQSIQSIYEHNGFLDATADYEVSSSSTSDRVIVTFLICEGERSRIRSVSYQGNTVYQSKELRKKVW